MKLHAQNVALTFAIVISGWHLLWTLLVVMGLAQSLLDFVFWMHMIANPYRVTGFSWTQGITLIGVTFLVGYGIGWIFAWVWNYLHSK